MPTHDLLSGTSTPETRSPRTARRLVVTWQHPDTRAIEPIGFLSCTKEGYEFVYIRHALDVPDFRPLLGFDDLFGSYSSVELFPLFAQRVMDPRRPDFQRYVERLGLEGEPSPWEQIARSQGRRTGDTLQVLPEPTVKGGVLRGVFLVSGVRHVPDEPVILNGQEISVTSDQLETALAGLTRGASLKLVPQPGNRVNSLALMLTDTSAVPVGWIPNLFVGDLHLLLKRSQVTVTVEHVNGPEAPWHLRLLASLTAKPAGDFRFFTGDQWIPLNSTHQ
jgi:hypothetical protein